MAAYSDLSVCTYFPVHCESLRAVGWLERGQPFATGDVEERAFKRLCELTQNPWATFGYAGFHRCNLCRFTGTSEAQYQDFRVSATAQGVSLFVPGDRVI